MQPLNTHVEPVFESAVLDERVRALSGDRPIATFGLKALDDLLGGIYPGQNYACGAIAGGGKTTLYSQEADKLARDGHPVVFVSAELPQHKLLAKSLARLSRGALTLGEVAAAASPEHPKHEAFLLALDEYRATIAPNLCITGPLNVTELGYLVSGIVNERAQIPILFVDYLQILACGSPSEPFVDERLAITACVKGLRSISNCYGCPVFVLSAITRNAYGSKKPGLGVFGGSSSVEYGFDAALLLTEQEEPPEYPFDRHPGTRLKLTALKNRYGATGTASLVFDAAHATFYDAE